MAKPRESYLQVVLKGIVYGITHAKQLWFYDVVPAVVRSTLRQLGIAQPQKSAIEIEAHVASSRLRLSLCRVSTYQQALIDLKH